MPGRDSAGRGLPGEPTAELGAAVAQVLDAGAATLEGGPDRPDLDRLARARAAVWETLDDLVGSPAATAEDDDALAAAVDEAFRLRLLSYGTAHIGVHCLMASGLAAPDPDRVAGFDTTGAPAEGPVGGAGPGPLRPALAAARREAASHLTTRSVWFRNSVRAAAALSVAVLVAQLAEVQHGFWVALGTLAVLRSSVSGTATNVAWAMAGTVAGIAVGGALIYFVGGDDAVMWALLPVAVLVAMYAPRGLSLAAFQAAFTVMILILFDLLQPVSVNVTLIRLEDVAIGCAVALALGLLLWPRGAAAAVRHAVGAALVSSVAYMDSSLDALFDGAPPEGFERTADEAHRSGRRLEDAFRQYLDERSPAIHELHSLTVLVAAAARPRFTGTGITFSRSLWRLDPAVDGSEALDASRRALAAERAAMRTWYRTVGEALAGAAEPPPPTTTYDGPGPHARRWLAGATAGGHEPELRHRVAIAWTGEHLGVLADLQPSVLQAAGALPV